MIKEENNSIKHLTEDNGEDAEDEEDNKPSSARLKMNSNNANKVIPVVVKNKKSSEDSDSDDVISLSVRLLRNSNLGTSSSNCDDSGQKEPISKVQKGTHVGSNDSIKLLRPSTLLVKRPLDKTDSLQSSVKKSKLSDPAASINAKHVSVKSEPKVEEDDNDDIPFSQRMKKSATSGYRSSSLKKLTNVLKVNKAGPTSFKKRAKKLKKSGNSSEHSKSTKLLPSSGDGQKKMDYFDS